MSDVYLTIDPGAMIKINGVPVQIITECTVSVNEGNLGLLSDIPMGASEDAALFYLRPADSSIGQSAEPYKPDVPGSSPGQPTNPDEDNQ